MLDLNSRESNFSDSAIHFYNGGINTYLHFKLVRHINKYSRDYG